METDKEQPLRDGEDDHAAKCLICFSALHQPLRQLHHGNLRTSRKQIGRSVS